MGWPSSDRTARTEQTAGWGDHGWSGETDMKKLLSTALLLTLAIFQYQLWFGGSSVRAVNALQDQLEIQHAGNQSLEERNRLLEVEVLDLKNGLEAVEERARTELGLIGKDELFVQYID
jgi:cell division protein FtsB